LDDEFIVRRKIEGQDQRIRQTALVKIPANVGCDNEIAMMARDFCDSDGQSFADDVPLYSAPDGCFAPVVT
jgi:hypothetical protein